MIRLAGSGDGIELEDLVPIDGAVASRRLFRARLGARPVVVKTVDTGSLAAATRALHWLSPQVPADGSLLLPTVLCADDAEHLLITTELPGSSLDALLAGRTNELGVVPTDVIARVGRALAELHALPVGPLPVTSMVDHLHDLVDPHPGLLASEAPSWRSTIDAALDVLAEHAEDGPAVITPIHRDFHARQVLVGDRIGIVDWDLAAAGDPLFDVATFTTHLATHGRDPDGRLTATFLKAYRSCRGLDVDVDRLAVYRLFHLLRRACRRHRLRDDGWPGGWRVERDRMLSLVAAARDGRS